MSQPIITQWIAKNAFLNRQEMENNATCFATRMVTMEGWTLEACAAMLGNMQSESTINPGIWQSLVDPFPPNPGSVGVGLVQWTPYTKYTNWAGAEWEDGEKQCDRIIYELENGIQWYATSAYNFSFREFSQSHQSPYYLAVAFLHNYERPADAGPSVERQRGNQALDWYEFISGLRLMPPYIFYAILAKAKRRTTIIGKRGYTIW